MNFREIYDIFIYENYDIKYTDESIMVDYVYKISDYKFISNVIIQKKDISNKNMNKKFLDYMFFNFGIINAINYYKLTCSPKILIKCGYLDKEQKEFFKKIFYNGLAELFYRNKLNINYSNFLEIETLGKKINFDISEEFSGNLIPFGGGKDSIVTLELLNSYKKVNSCFIYKRNIYPTDLASINGIHMAGYCDEDIKTFNISFDPLMLKLNHKGFYNGHIPFSSNLAFASYIMAYLNNKEYIILSNESSANEGNIKDLKINHQYSKSFEFEKDFRKYTFKYFTDKIKYFSLLRCWNEIRIVKEFVKYPKYLDVFRSCNIGSKMNSWCSECAKCLYTYIMLYPFVEETKLIRIFGKNMLDDGKYIDIFLALINYEYDKPFECVGTKEEINYSLSLSVEKYSRLPLLLKLYKQKFYNRGINYNLEKYFNNEHFIDLKFLKIMGKENDEKTNN